MSVHICLVNVEIFHRINENFDLRVVVVSFLLAPTNASALDTLQQNYIIAAPPTPTQIHIISQA